MVNLDVKNTHLIWSPFIISTAVETVLAKRGHVMKDAVTLEPYFPAYHDYVMENMVAGAEKSTTGEQRSHVEEDLGKMDLLTHSHLYV